MTGISGRWFTV